MFLDSHWGVCRKISDAVMQFDGSVLKLVQVRIGLFLSAESRQAYLTLAEHLSTTGQGKILKRKRIPSKIESRPGQSSSDHLSKKN